MLLLTPLLLRPFLEFVLFPPTLPSERASFPVNIQLLWTFVRSETYTAAKMALGRWIVVPVILEYRRVGPLDAVFAVFAGRLACFWRLFPVLSSVGIGVLAFKEDVPSSVG